MASIKEMMEINRADFSTVEKDFEEITTRILSNEDLVKLLYFSAPDCLRNEEYVVTPEILETVAQQHVKIVPSLKIPENEGSYIIITFDNFVINPSNPEFMDNIIFMDVMSPIEAWVMDSYMLRPFRIKHELQREFSGKPLNGIGKMSFITSNILNLGDYVGYQMAFKVINDV